MIELIKVVDGKPRAYTHKQFRGDYKTTGAADKHLNPRGVYRVFPKAAPAEAVGFKLVAESFPALVDGRWMQGYTSVEMNAAEARIERDSLLQSTDWMAVTDRTMTGPETAYRQSLRDVPQQAGFPKSVGWPSKPV